jgi:hypothetical protein
VHTAVAGHILDGLGTILVQACDFRRLIGRLLGRLLLRGAATRRYGCGRRCRSARGRTLIHGLLLAAPSQGRQRQREAQRRIATAHAQRMPCRYDARLRMSSGDRRLAMVSMMPFGPVARAPDA